MPLVLTPDYYDDGAISSREAHTTRETDNFDLDYILRQRKDYYIASGQLFDTRGDKLKKHLILNDCTAHFWGVYKALAVKRRLIELMNEGFRVYLGDDERTLLSPETIDRALAAYQETVFLKHDDDLRTEVSERLSKAAKNFYCLNYFEINRLLAEKAEITRYIKASDLSYFNASKPHAKQLKLLNHFKELDVEGLEHDLPGFKSSQDWYKTLPDIKAMYPEHLDIATVDNISDDGDSDYWEDAVQPSFMSVKMPLSQCYAISFAEDGFRAIK
jgi:hypothetical protein